MNAWLSALTSSASPGPIWSSSARGATAAQMIPAATPSTALPARAATNAASRPFVGPPSSASSLRHDRTRQSVGQPLAGSVACTSGKIDAMASKVASSQDERGGVITAETEKVTEGNSYLPV